MTDEDLERFIQEMLLRFDKQTARHEASMSRMQASIDACTRRSDEVILELRDLRAESQAQRGALLALIDRLGPGGAAA